MRNSILAGCQDLSEHKVYLKAFFCYELILISVSLSISNSVIWSLHGKSNSDKAKHFHPLVTQVSGHSNYVQMSDTYHATAGLT